MKLIYSERIQFQVENVGYGLREQFRTGKQEFEGEENAAHTR